MKTLGEDVSPPQPRGCEWMIRLLSSFHAFISIRYEVLISPPRPNATPSSGSCASLAVAYHVHFYTPLHIAPLSRCKALQRSPSPPARISLSFVLMTEEGESGTMYPHFVRPRPEAVFPAICQSRPYIVKNKIVRTLQQIIE